MEWLSQKCAFKIFLDSAKLWRLLPKASMMTTTISTSGPDPTNPRTTSIFLASIGLTSEIWHCAEFLICSPLIIRDIKQKGERGHFKRTAPPPRDCQGRWERLAKSWCSGWRSFHYFFKGKDTLYPASFRIPHQCAWLTSCDLCKATATRPGSHLWPAAQTCVHISLTQWHSHTSDCFHCNF